MELKTKFEEIQGERDLKDITELDLDKVKAHNFEGLPNELPEVIVINASGLGLENLNGLPSLPKLHTLDLSENKLTGAVLHLIGEKCPSLEQLNLCGNEIVDIDSLKALLNAKSLMTLDLLENPITNVENYRDEVFKLFPKLQYLDGYDANNEEIDISINEGESASDGEIEDEGDDDEEEEEVGESASDGEIEDEGDDDEEEEEVGLSYLDSSKCLEEDDDSPDFDIKGKKETATRKRKADTTDEASNEKQAKGDA
uniref:Acidic leucine-rich nuclear phosphoprotein 32 family member A n=1 Tax=Panagrolaimus sp. JU765 TaxID=591449 RepID=A0AC34QL48_9BILA